MFFGTLVYSSLGLWSNVLWDSGLMSFGTLVYPLCCGTLVL